MADERPGAMTEPGSGGVRQHAWVGWLVAIAVGLVLAALVRAFVCETFVVPSGSMLDTIQIGDLLLGEKVSPRASGVHAGEIVTFDDPDNPGTTLVKRVVATGGQVVELKDGQAYVDGTALSEPYVEGRPTYPLDRWSSTALDGPVSYPYVVPDGSVWVMGDNRTNSLDSRYFGAVPVSSVTSHVLFVWWPLSDASVL